MSKRAFIVDDNKIVRQFVRASLESRLEHIDCVEASDGLEAIERARELRPDVIVLDLCMSVMNGLEAAAALQRLLPRVPIILYTLHKDIVPESCVQGLGIRAVVSKTDQIGVLLDQILRFTGLASAASA
jgi:CheY-like chemotaxis protein